MADDANTEPDKAFMLHDLANVLQRIDDCQIRTAPLLPEFTQVRDPEPFHVLIKMRDCKDVFLGQRARDDNVRKWLSAPVTVTLHENIESEKELIKHVRRQLWADILFRMENDIGPLEQYPKYFTKAEFKISRLEVCWREDSWNQKITDNNVIANLSLLKTSSTLYPRRVHAYTNLDWDAPALNTPSINKKLSLKRKGDENTDSEDNPARESNNSDEDSDAEKRPSTPAARPKYNLRGQKATKLIK